MKKTDCIVLRSERPRYECVGAVRLTEEAERAVRRLRDKTGLSIRRIVSEIIVQAEPIIRIEPAEEE